MIVNLSYPFSLSYTEIQVIFVLCVIMGFQQTVHCFLLCDYK